MGRAPRMLAAGATYHVMARGNNHQPIFLDDADRERFLGMFGDVVTHRSWAHLAYCLMGNHFHSVVRTDKADLSHGMRDLLGRYARAFNTERGRSGRLFDDRFHGVPIESDEQLLQTVRYVARNPVRAGLVERAEEWRWGSYAPVLAGEPGHASLDVGGLLGLFHPIPKRAVSLLRAFVVDEGPEAKAGTALSVDGRPRLRPSPANLSLVMATNDAVAAARALGHTQEQIAASLGLSRSSVAHRMRRRRAGSGKQGIGGSEGDRRATSH